MKLKIITPAIAGILIVFGLFVFVLQNDEKENEITPQEFNYDSNSDIKKSLEIHDILMSNPLKLQGEDMDQYCMFFGDPSVQERIEYCTSTEIKDSSGKFLGNIHMIGDSTAPQVVMAIIQSDPFISQENQISLIFESIIENVVCDCWQNVKPGGFHSVSDWVKAAKEHHLEAKRTTSKSEISGLAQKQIILEITTNNDGYLWKFLVDK